MNIQEYLDKMKLVQSQILNFLENETNVEENFQNLNNLINDHKIKKDLHKLQLTLHLIVAISDNHHHVSNFFSKIERILQIFKKEIAKFFKNSEIFNIFKSNKRILLFLIEEGILIVDKYIVSKITCKKFIELKYPEYFAQEIRPYINEQFIKEYNKNKLHTKNNEWIEKLSKKLPVNFNEKRKIGENDNPICKIIRDDSIKDFINYIKQTNISLQDSIDISIYETNSFLLKKKKISLIEYAAFFGSVKIFKYINQKGIELEPSLWIYAIYGNNMDIIIHLNKFLPKQTNVFYFNSYIKSIKCHHIRITNYIYERHLNDINSSIVTMKCLKYYNFAFIKDKVINSSSFYDLCQFDYWYFVDYILMEIKIDLNKLVI